MNLIDYKLETAFKANDNKLLGCLHFKIREGSLKVENMLWFCFVWFKPVNDVSRITFVLYNTFINFEH